MSLDRQEKLNGGLIEGNGEDFLAASAALLHALNPSGQIEDFGTLLTCYFLARRDSERHIGSTMNGYIFSVKNEGSFLSFAMLHE